MEIDQNSKSSNTYNIFSILHNNIIKVSIKKSNKKKKVEGRFNAITFNHLDIQSCMYPPLSLRLVR